MSLFCLELNAPCSDVNGVECSHICYDCVQCVNMDEEDEKEEQEE